MADTEGWNGPRRGGTDGLERLMRELEQVKSRLAAVERGAPLRAAGIGVDEDGMTVQSSLTVDGGDLTVTGNATFGGNTTIGGNAAITGTLSLPSGIIDNDALANPVTFNSNSGSTNNIGIPGSDTYFTPSDLTVPEGFSLAMVWGIASCSVRNTSGGPAYVFLRSRIDALTSGWWQQSGFQEALVPDNGWVSLYVPLIAAGYVTGGETLRVRAVLYGSASSPVETGSWIGTEAAGIYSR